MAQIKTEIMTVTISRLVKNTQENTPPLMNAQLTENVETIIQELLGETVMVEVEVLNYANE
jgi:hypothetical protein